LKETWQTQAVAFGTHVAVFGCARGGCTVRIADQSGRTVATSKPYYDWWGLAWAPGGKEVWFSVAESSGRQCTVFAMDLAGHERMMFRAPGALTVHDVSAEGRLLASLDQVAHRLETSRFAGGANPRPVLEGRRSPG
jgi:hypothetical protein